jgi:MoaA/NifB/PqqE/SkfB family radical SAM enzyme
MTITTPPANNTSSCLRFLWLELTECCNLRCVHCYADSNPRLPLERKMQKPQWEKVIAEASRIGCLKIQFIGGEVTLVPYLTDLIRFARHTGISSVEVFTNATLLDSELIDVFKQERVSIATSFYSCDSSIHDHITQKPGSWRVTLDAITRLQDALIPVRVGIISMPSNESSVAETIQFLGSRGISRVGIDHARSFGRSVSLVGRDTSFSELCGQCGDHRACVVSTGDVYPCIMSRTVTLGNVITDEIDEIVRNKKIQGFRRDLLTSIAEVKGPSNCRPDSCSPQDDCAPKYCNPDFCCEPNEPNGCSPFE